METKESDLCYCIFLVFDFWCVMQSLSHSSHNPKSQAATHDQRLRKGSGLNLSNLRTLSLCLTGERAFDTQRQEKADRRTIDRGEESGERVPILCHTLLRCEQILSLCGKTQYRKKREHNRTHVTELLNPSENVWHRKVFFNPISLARRAKSWLLLLLSKTF